MKEPLCEDDYPDDQIVSLPSFEVEGDNISLNFIREENKDYFKLINAQIQNNKNDGVNKTFTKE